jgi:hypothetical protein
MSAPVYVTFRHMHPRAELEEYVRDQAGRLDRLYARIVDCRVCLEPSDAGLLRAVVEVTVPGERLVASYESDPERDTAPEPGRPPLGDIRWLHVVHEAFAAAARMLETYRGRRLSRVRPRAALRG